MFVIVYYALRNIHTCIHTHIHNVQYIRVVSYMYYSICIILCVLSTRA